MLWSLNMVHFQFPLSLWAHQLQIEFLSLTVQPLEGFARALRVSWSRLLVCVQSGPYTNLDPTRSMIAATLYSIMWKSGCLHQQVVSSPMQITGDDD